MIEFVGPATAQPTLPFAVMRRLRRLEVLRAQPKQQAIGSKSE